MPSDALQASFIKVFNFPIHSLAIFTIFFVLTLLSFPTDLYTIPSIPLKFKIYIMDNQDLFHRGDAILK
jgi:hypothetical protein